MASNLVFTWQALVGVNLWALTLTIIVENTGAIGTVIFIAYLSALCYNLPHRDAIRVAHRARRGRADLLSAGAVSSPSAPAGPGSSSSVR